MGGGGRCVQSAVVSPTTKNIKVEVPVGLLNNIGPYGIFIQMTSRRSTEPETEILSTTPVQYDDWQSGKWLADCNMHMLVNQIACDVTFRFDGTSEVIPAHKYVLISRSCVFYHILSDEEITEFEIHDVNVPVFKTFLR